MSFSAMHLYEFAQGTADSSLAIKLWVPSEQVVVHRLQVPAGSRQKISTLVPWMLEDDLLHVVEDMHFVLGPIDANRQAWVASVPRAVIGQWCSQVSAQQNNVPSMAPDFLALPWEEGAISLLVQSDRWVVRCGRYQGCAGKPGFVIQLLPQLLSENPEQSLSVIGAIEELPAHLAAHATQVAGNLNWSFADYPDELNLMQGEFRGRRTLSHLRNWWPSAAAVASCLILALLLAGTNVYRYQRDIPQLENGVSQVYQTLFAGAPRSMTTIRTDALERRDAREQQYLATRAAPLELMLKLDPLLSACNGCQVKSLQAQDNQVILVMQNDEDFASQLLALSGIEVQTQTTNDGDDLIITLKSGGEG